MMSNKQLLPILNSTPHQITAASKDGLDFNDQMIQFNLTLLANYCDTNSSAANNNQLKSLVNLNNNDNLTPNHNLIAQQQNNANNSFIKSPSMLSNNNSVIQSSTLNTSLLEQHLQELSFNESLLNTQNSNQNASFNLSKASTNDARLNDSSIAISNELNSISHMNMNSSFASPTSDHSSSGLPTPNTKSGKNVMAIRSKFGHLGSNQGQFSSPHGFCLGVDEEIVIADTYNHRICIFEKDGKFSYQFGSAGKEEGELWHPRKVG